MGLRLTEGVDLDRIAYLAGGEAPVDLPAIGLLERQGLLARDGPRLRATEAGALLLDGILRAVVRAETVAA